MGTESRRRLLFLLPFAPRLEATNGGGRALAQLLDNLASRHALALLYLRGDDELPLDPAFTTTCDVVEEVHRQSLETSGWRYHARLWPALLRGTPQRVQEWHVPAFVERARALARAWKPDVIHGEFSVMGGYLAALEGYPAPRVLTIYEPVARASRDLWKARQVPGTLLPLLDMLAWHRFERAGIMHADTVIAFTETDCSVLAELGASTPIVRIPFGTVLPPTPLDPVGQDPPNIVFVGNFRHPPNVDAGEWLANTIMPRVRMVYEHVILQLVGDAPTPRIQQLANDQVVVTGKVQDVVPYLDRAAIVVVPLRLGGGMRVKVLEALAAGKAVVATPLAIAGLDLVDGEQLLVAQDEASFSAAILRLLANPNERAAIAARARAWACEHLGWNLTMKKYEALYNSLLARSV